MFDQQLEKDGIPHLSTYPNCPQIDTFIERYNRTLQEEFIDYHLDIIHDKKLFNQKLADWNIYYDINRRHHSLGLVSPLKYFVEKGGMSHKYLTYTMGLQKTKRESKMRPLWQNQMVNKYWEESKAR